MVGGGTAAGTATQRNREPCCGYQPARRRASTTRQPTHLHGCGEVALAQGRLEDEQAHGVLLPLVRPPGASDGAGQKGRQQVGEAGCTRAGRATRAKGHASARRQGRGSARRKQRPGLPPRCSPPAAHVQRRLQQLARLSKLLLSQQHLRAGARGTKGRCLLLPLKAQGGTCAQRMRSQALSLPWCPTGCSHPTSRPPAPSAAAARRGPPPSSAPASQSRRGPRPRLHQVMRG